MSFGLVCFCWGTVIGSHNDTSDACPSSISDRGAYNIGLYYVNWAIYARNFLPSSLPYAYLTHVFYAFADIQPDGTVVLSDPWADTDKHLQNEPWTSGHNLYGCIKELFLLKKQNRNLKTLLSIGGWTYSPKFSDVAVDAEKRAVFARTATALVTSLGFDGIDIDWEYPTTTTEAQAFTSLLRECRSALDQAAGQNTLTRFHISVAVSAGSSHYEVLDIQNMDPLVDLWNLMGYDYAGAFSQLAGHHANVFNSSSCPASTPFNTAGAVQYYLSHGATAQKILLGMPLYGHSFMQTKGFGEPFRGVGLGSWDAGVSGVYDYKALPLPGTFVGTDDTVVASWSYDDASEMLVSYDNTVVAAHKARYVRQNGLGGGMWWESSGDRAFHNGSLVEAFVSELGGLSALRKEQNCVDYPSSPYENLRAQFATR